MEIPQRRKRLDKELQMCKGTNKELNRKRVEHQIWLAIEQEHGARRELEMVLKWREQWANERGPEIEREIKRQGNELQQENEKFKLAVSAAVEKWIENEGWSKLNM